MKNFYILLFFFLCFFNIIKICGTTIRHKSKGNKNKYEVNDEFGKINNKTHISKRNLDGEEDEEMSPIPLKIFIDTVELYASCSPLSNYLGNIEQAMNNAKNELEKFLLIIPAANEFKFKKEVSGVITDYIIDTLGIPSHNEILDYPIPKTQYNYFIFGKCIDDNINEDSAPVILEYQDGSPYAGVVLFNIKPDYLNNLDASKFTLDNLRPLMLHHFIRLLGFNSEASVAGFIPSDSNGYYLKTEDDDINFDNVIDYAKEFFGCPNIQRLNLYVDNENLDELENFYDFNDIDIVGLYWPKEIFAGELLTKYDYSEEKTLSGFTWAFLDDLPYLQVTKNYKGEITRFGENTGCKCKCTSFDTGVYGDDFWDCTDCAEGYFKAMKGSSESETTCESNNNKDYYFLYNQDLEIYRKCEFEISNCLKCSSQTQCTSCFNGFLLEQENGKSICKKEEKEEDDDDDGLSTGAIIGIVFGCVGFLLLVALTIFCLIMRKKEKKEEKPEKKIIETAKEEVKDPLEDDIKVIEYDKKSEIMDATAKRINNKSKNIV